ncbi:MAG: hypothetical protein ACOCU6_02000 [Nanoarchaeota archaeon]
MVFGRKKTSHEKANEYVDSFESTIRKYPLTTIVTSFALGAVLSSLISKKKK